MQYNLGFAPYSSIVQFCPLFPYCSVFSPFLPIVQLSPLIPLLFSFRPLFPYCLVFAPYSLIVQFSPLVSWCLVFAPYSPASLYLNNIVECRSQTYSHNYHGLNERHSFYSSIIFIAPPPPSSSSSGKGERFDVLMNRGNFFYNMSKIRNDNLILRP